MGLLGPLEHTELEAWLRLASQVVFVIGLFVSGRVSSGRMWGHFSEDQLPLLLFSQVAAWSCSPHVLIERPE